MDAAEFRAWEQRVTDKAAALWEQADRPEGGPERFRDAARELLAIAENPDATTRSPDSTAGAGVEPLLAVENQGEFPTLTDQGEEQAYPRRRDPAAQDGEEGPTADEN